MAEFCPDCLNRMTGRKHLRIDYRLSRGVELCEGCGRVTRIVEERRFYGGRYASARFSAALMAFPFRLLWWLVTEPYWIWQRRTYGDKTPKQPPR